MKYQEYAEFFRLIGVFVCENFRTEEFDLIIEPQVDFEYDLDEDSGLDLEQEYVRLLNLDGAESDSDEIIASFVVEIFQKYHLFQASVTLQYFYFGTPIVNYAGIYFWHAAQELEDFLENHADIVKSDYQIRYAALYCKQKANLADSLLVDRLSYSIADLLKEANELLEDFPNCSNTWMLVGLICEISKEYKMNAIEAFKKAADAVRGKLYSASILYRLGKNCEGVEVLEFLKNDAYEQAYRLMPKYRNIYKVARQYMDMEIWDIAIEYFLECLEKIEWHGDYLDPLEQEYYFKVCSHLAYIYNKKKDYMSAIGYAESALDLKNEIYDTMDEPEGYDKIYYEIYGRLNEEGWKPEEIICVELKRMASKNIYHHLAVAYQGLGFEDVAGEYWNLVKR